MLLPSENTMHRGFPSVAAEAKFGVADVSVKKSQNLCLVCFHWEAILTDEI